MSIPSRVLESPGSAWKEAGIAAIYVASAAGRGKPVANSLLSASIDFKIVVRSRPVTCGRGWLP